MTADLDAFDLRLLAALQREGRAPNAALAETVGLSASQVSRRLARLEAEGVIAAYAALLKPDAVGLSVLAFSSVSLERQAEAMDGFEAAMLRFPEILECYSVTGEQDFVLRIVAKDLKAFADFLSNRLLRVPGVRSVRSSIVLHTIKQTTALPLP
ncbi:Lrp/AsnC family transcriptional regulator [Ferrovibrio terrae]|uniref:Lrp/AsnC family transcriptional regulator n=1 Tax=Ferrovibrio terrae TaxID=2594003 RepID=A0A516GZ61_9PROT|nr:Lrp/AsnC family transcriptional regulator [Ferrovibrio terrae]QDO96821.1 Lrp/AsnC family transcriptional regulator [Ferrovibrio terrae]